MKVQPIPTQIEAEQYLEDATNWYSMHSLIKPENVEEEFTPSRKLTVTYDNRDFELKYGDWVVMYPDSTLHFFSKATFDELFHNPFTDDLRPEEIDKLLEIAS